MGKHSFLWNIQLALVTDWLTQDPGIKRGSQINTHTDQVDGTSATAVCVHCATFPSSVVSPTSPLLQVLCFAPPLPKHHRALATFHSRHRERAPVTFKKPSEERKKGGKRKEKKTGRPLTGNSQATTHWRQCHASPNEKWEPTAIPTCATGKQTAVLALAKI